MQIECFFSPPHHKSLHFKIAKWFNQLSKQEEEEVIQGETFSMIH